MVNRLYFLLLICTRISKNETIILQKKERERDKEMKGKKIANNELKEENWYAHTRIWMKNLK